MTYADDNIDHGRPRRQMNLNGLYALDAILHSSSLSEAARVLSLSQPAISMALRKLRDHFGDDLVSYQGGRRELTALAVELRPRIRGLLREADDVLHLDLEFNPRTATRSIAIAAPEPIEIMLLSRLLPALLRDAPGVDVQLMPFDYGGTNRMFDRGVDLVIVPESLAWPGLVSRPLFEQGMVAMTWDQHPLAGQRLSIEEYLSSRHAALFERIERQEFGDAHRDPMFAGRRVVVRTGLYSTLPSLVIGTDLVVTTTSWLAQYHAAMLPLTLIELPVARALPPMVAQWQPHRSREPMIQWLLRALLMVIGQFGPVGNRWYQED